MTEMYITPFNKCGSVVGGTPYSLISKQFSDHESFTKGPFSKFVTSTVLDGALHIYYSESGMCVGVEVFPPLVAIWDGINLFDINLKELVRIMRNKGQDIEIEDAGIELPNLGFSIYSHDFEEDLICSIDGVYINLIQVK